MEVHGDYYFFRPHGQAVKTSPFHGGNTSSNLVGVIWTQHFICADVAQLAEQLICNQQVIGSSPIIGLYKFYIVCEIWFRTFSSVG